MSEKSIEMMLGVCWSEWCLMLLSIIITPSATHNIYSSPKGARRPEISKIRNSDQLEYVFVSSRDNRLRITRIGLGRLGDYAPLA